MERAFAPLNDSLRGKRVFFFVEPSDAELTEKGLAITYDNRSKNKNRVEGTIVCVRFCDVKDPRGAYGEIHVTVVTDKGNFMNRDLAWCKMTEESLAQLHTKQAQPKPQEPVQPKSIRSRVKEWFARRIK